MCLSVQRKTHLKTFFWWIKNWFRTKNQNCSRKVRWTKGDREGVFCKVCFWTAH